MDALLLDKCLQITPAFEGGGFDNLSSNFDGEGLSAGILQWCLGQGSLQENIIRPYLAHYGSIDALGIFPNKVDFIVNLTTKSAVEYAIKEMHNWSLLPAEKRSLKPAWKAAWKVFLSKPEVIQIQKTSCIAIYEAADRLRAKWGMTSNLALFWFFDLLTQNGSLKGVEKPNFDLKEASDVIGKVEPKCRSEWLKIDLKSIEQERVILLVASHRRALLARSQYYNDVLARKGTIALGRGFVHGNKIDLSAIIA